MQGEMHNQGDSTKDCDVTLRGMALRRSDLFRKYSISDMGRCNNNLGATAATQGIIVIIQIVAPLLSLPFHFIIIIYHDSHFIFR